MLYTEDQVRELLKLAIDHSEKGGSAFNQRLIELTGGSVGDFRYTSNFESVIAVIYDKQTFEIMNTYKMEGLTIPFRQEFKILKDDLEEGMACEVWGREWGSQDNPSIWALMETGRPKGADIKNIILKAFEIIDSHENDFMPNEHQKAFLESYEGGEFSYLANALSREEFYSSVRLCGDSFVGAVMVELEDEMDVDEAVRRIERISENIAEAAEAMRTLGSFPTP